MIFVFFTFILIRLIVVFNILGENNISKRQLYDNTAYVF